MQKNDAGCYPIATEERLIAPGIWCKFLPHLALSFTRSLLFTS